MVKSSLDGEVYAFSAMLAHMSMLRVFYGHFMDLYPGMVGFKDCERLFAHLKNKEVATEKFFVRRFLAIQ